MAAIEFNELEANVILEAFGIVNRQVGFNAFNPYAPLIQKIQASFNLHKEAIETPKKSAEEKK